MNEHNRYPILRHSVHVVGRNNLGRFFSGLGLITSGVEVGTHRGEFAEQLLKSWRGKLYCVDSYQPLYDPDDPAAMGNRIADMEAAKDRLKPFGSRVEFVVRSSLEAAARFATGSLDFVYIDAKHRYQDVLDDLNGWWPKIKPGGVLAGHDIICPGMEPLNGGWGREIQPAVCDFFGPLHLDVWLVPERDEIGWSFYTFKT